MREVTHFCIKTLAVSTVIVIVIYIMAIPVYSIYKSVVADFNVFWIWIVLGALFCATLMNAFYIKPLNFVANLLLTSAAYFYKESFNQATKYFAKENLTNPFQTIVEISLTDSIKVFGFVTNRISNQSSVVFVPTSRRMSSGITLVVLNQNIKETNLSSEDFFKFVMTSGAFIIKQ